ncbi:hypothetical protein PTI98_013239 [Pleurotus ostreatus]|nr:hypothetical protein PTI98_013239 [Pleurotus ostreatus]
MGAGISLELANYVADWNRGYWIWCNLRVLTCSAGSRSISSYHRPWVASFIVLTLSTNVVCTSLILYGILRIHSAVKDFAIIIVESAAVYSASVISLMTMYSVGSNAQYTVLDMTGPLIGITFRYIAALLN